MLETIPSQIQRADSKPRTRNTKAIEVHVVPALERQFHSKKQRSGLRPMPSGANVSSRLNDSIQSCLIYREMRLRSIHIAPRHVNHARQYLEEIDAWRQYTARKNRATGKLLHLRIFRHPA